MKIFRDPIHNVIDLDTGDKAVNGLLLRLIDSREFQRLRFVRQLGFAYFAYPGANHTRFEHSLGVAFLAKRFLDKIIASEEKITSLYQDSNNKYLLAEFFALIKKERHVAIVASLLHDIGHGPLSHVFERLVPGINHEEWTQAIILGDTDVNRVLTDFGGVDFPGVVCGLLAEGTRKQGTAAKIIAGQLDIDKIDYILRDSYMTGAGYGKFDVEWLFNVLTVGITSGRVEVGLDLGKGLSVAEDFVMARIYMFRNIYLHKTSLVAGKMLELLVERVRELPADVAGKIFPNHSLRRVLLEDSAVAVDILADYVAVSDIDIFAFLRLAQDCDDKTISTLGRALLQRQLFKRIDPRDLAKAQQFAQQEKGEHQSKYYIAQLGKNTVQTYQAHKECISLFDKNGEGFALYEKSVIIPSSVWEDFPEEYYVEQSIYGAIK